MAAPKVAPKPAPKPTPKAQTPGAKAQANAQAAANAQFKASQAAAAAKSSLKTTGAPGRTPVVNAATGFVTGTKAVAPVVVQSPRASGYTAAKPDPGPLGGVGQFIQQHIDLATGKTPTNISQAVKEGAARPYGALSPTTPRKR